MNYPNIGLMLLQKQLAVMWQDTIDVDYTIPSLLRMMAVHSNDLWPEF